MMISVIFTCILVSAHSVASWVVPKIASASYSDFTCWLRGNGEVKCWGANGAGQLGYGDKKNRGDDPYDMGTNWTAVDFGAGRSAVQIAVGEMGACAVLDNGQLKCWGENGAGQLGYGDENNRGDDPDDMGTNWTAVDLGDGRQAVGVATSYEHTCALLDNSEVKCWGANGDGQLGCGDTKQRGNDPYEMGSNLTAVDLGAGQSVVQIAAGEEHTCVVLDKGQLKCWGANGEGQLGCGDTESRGDDPDDMGTNLTAVDLGAGRSVVQVVTGNDHSCALLDNGEVKCWGGNDEGQLGYGDENNRGDDPYEMGANLTAVDLGASHSTVQIAVGKDHSCAVLDNGQLKCWGENDEGQLGYGDKKNRGDDPYEMGANLTAVDLGAGRSAMQVTAGDSHTCALLDNGEVTCWGANGVGQLGRGDEEHFYEMGANLTAIFRVMTSTTTTTASTTVTNTTFNAAAMIDSAKSRGGLSAASMLLGIVYMGLQF